MNPIEQALYNSNICVVCNKPKERHARCGCVANARLWSKDNRVPDKMRAYPLDAMDKFSNTINSR